MGVGYAVYNEIILTGLAHLPVRYSDRIIDYITESFNDNVFAVSYTHLDVYKRQV